MTQWQRVRLKHLAAVPIVNGVGEPGEYEEPDWPRYIRTTDIAGPRRLRDDVFKSLPPAIAHRAPLVRGDLVMVAAGATIGKSYLHESDQPACFAGYLVRFRPRGDVDSRFIACWTESSPYWQQIESQHVKATIENFSAARYRNLVLDVPSYEEQQRIADYLDRETARIDAVVQQKRLLLEQLQERRRSVIFQGVTGLLGGGHEVHDPGVPWARAVRKPWPVVKIKHVAWLGTGHTPSRSRPDLWENCTIPWVTTGEIQQVRNDRVEVITETREKVSELGIANSAAVLHPAGTVVLCRTASAGFSAIMGTDMATSQDFATWTCSDRLLPRYLLMCLRGMRRDLLGRLAFGSTHKTIYMPDIEDLKIPLPTIGGQHEVLAEIDSRIAEIDALSDRLESQLALLAEHRQALITAAVAGEVDVPD